MESTLLQSFLRAANLKRWLAKPDCPAVIKECKALFDKIYAPKVPDSDVGDSSLQDDVADTEHVTGSDATLDALLQNAKGKVATRARLRHNGIIYSTSITHLGNSLVQFYPNGDTALSPVPGCIKHIFSERNRLYLAIQRQLPLDSPIPDPFALYLNFLLRCIHLIFLRLLSEWKLDGFIPIMLDGKCLQNMPLYYLSIGYVVYFLLQFLVLIVLHRNEYC